MFSKLKILLIQAQNSPAESGLRFETWYLPLGLLSIAAALRQSGFRDVSVFDLQHDSLLEVERCISVAKRPVLVGVNFNVFSTGLLDSVLHLAKMAGATTVVGGQAATPIPQRLLKTNLEIDAVVVYDGERPMVEIAQRLARGKNDLRGIPNVVVRGDCNFKYRPLRGSRDASAVEAPDVWEYPSPDYGLIDLRRYISSWNRPAIDPNRVPASAYTQKGCGRACTFCARIDKKLRQRKPSQIREEFEALQAEGVNYVYVVDDTFAADSSFLRRLADCLDGAGPELWCFAGIRDLDSERVELLKRLRVEKALIGIESGSEELRRRNGKIFSDDLLFRRLELMAEAGVKVEDSYVLGLAGETQETLWLTYSLARKVASVCKTEGTAFNIMLPLLGSPDWNRLSHVPALAKKYGSGYRFDIDELRDDYFRHFCSLDSGDCGSQLFGSLAVGGAAD